ncbi:MAG: hypothetical protein QOG99_288 [Frankiales bacterium]|nr:hypothetical protein [Frankiales bacterium]
MTDVTCRRCGRPGQLELQMTIKEGPTTTILTMLSCGRCENRTWRVDGEEVSTARALAVVAGRDDFALVHKPRGS